MFHLITNLKKKYWKTQSVYETVQLSNIMVLIYKNCKNVQQFI